jgi:hypothetical protein
MRNSNGIFRSLPFYAFAAGVFLIIVCKDILANGMFLDGLIYSTVARNLSTGLGSFWNPHFTSTLMAEFHEHPPLSFGIQSLFFSVLGDSRFTDRFFSIFTVIITGIVILKIWKILGFKNGWLPLFIWIITPTVFWASYNNLLENTLSIFTSLSILSYLKYRENQKILLISLSGIMLSAGFLTKGFVAFFPWTLPFLYWLYLERKSFGRMTADTLMLFGFTLIPLLLLIGLFPDVRLSLHKYVDNQVINSIRNIVTVNSRFDIIKRLLSEIAPAAGLCMIILIYHKIRKSSLLPDKVNVRKSLLFISLGLTGVLPIMISMKQSGFYIVPVYPLFSIGLAILIYPVVNSFISDIRYESTGFMIIRWVAYGFLASGIILSVYYSGGFSRDKKLVEDTTAVCSVIPAGTIINISPEIYEDWSLHAYFARFKNISLDRDVNNRRQFLLIKNEYYSDTLNSRYNIVKLKTSDYSLFKMKPVQ